MHRLRAYYLRRFRSGLVAILAIVAVVPAYPAEQVVTSIGLNKFDLARQYTGTASGGDGTPRYLRVTRAMARKSLIDASETGAHLIRISASGFHPSTVNRPGDLDLWVSNPAAYWTLIDAMFDDLDEMKLKLVPVLIWNATQFPSMNNETLRDLVVNPESGSFRMAARYTREFVRRYKVRNTILFYELTNELNLGADLDLVERCIRKWGYKPSADRCDTRGNFTTDEMIAFTRRLAAIIRQEDAARKISSGFSVPRTSSAHLKAQPEWVSGSADFTRDSLAQFERYLEDIHVGVDIISVHLYPGKRNARFGDKDPNGTSLLDHSVRVAARVGKPLFIGEFGDAGRTDADPDSYTVRMIDRIVELKVPYSAVWVWGFYQRSPYQRGDNQDKLHSLDPGFTDDLIRKITRANRMPDNPLPLKAAKDETSPRLVLTWPLNCTLTSGLQRVHAVASDDSGQLQNVVFLVDNHVVAKLQAPPFETVLKVGQYGAGEHVLKAKATDVAGNTAISEVVFVVGASSSGSCKQVFP